MDIFLARKFAKGDHNAFKELYEMHFSRALRLAVAILKNEEAAKDIVQISFMRAYEYRSSYNPKKDFSFWFNKILVNECRRVLHKNSKQHVVYEDSYSFSIQSTEDIYKFERFELLYTALQKLSDDMRIPLLLKYINGFKEMEIAEILDLKKSTVKSRLYEGRKKVKDFMLSNGYREYRYE